MAGGENFERKPLNFSGTTLTRSEVKKDINDFKRDYFEYSRFFSNKAKMEKKGSSYERIYVQLNECLASLYKIVASMPWLGDDDYVDLMRAAYADSWGRRNDYESYSDLFQNILAKIETHIGSFGKVTGDAKVKMFAIYDVINAFIAATKSYIYVPQSIFNYLTSSCHLAECLNKTLCVCQYLKLL